MLPLNEVRSSRNTRLPIAHRIGNPLGLQGKRKRGDLSVFGVARLYQYIWIPTTQACGIPHPREVQETLSLLILVMNIFVKAAEVESRRR